MALEIAASIRAFAAEDAARVLIVTGSVEARPESIGRLLELGLVHVQRSRQEPGCRLHSLHRDVENDLRVVFIEHWDDAEALQAHDLALAFDPRGQGDSEIAMAGFARMHEE